MERNHIILAGTGFALFFLVSAKSLFAQQITMQFSGNVVTHTCDVLPSANINLGDVNIKDDTLDGRTLHPFSVTFRNCPSGGASLAHMTFSGIA